MDFCIVALRKKLVRQSQIMQSVIQDYQYVLSQPLDGSQSPIFPCTTPTQGHFVLFRVSLASRDRDGGRTERSTSTISQKNRGL